MNLKEFLNPKLKENKPKENVSKPKKKVVTLSQDEELAMYYTNEKKRIGSFLKEVEAKRVKAQLDVLKKNLMHLKAKKDELDSLIVDLDKHLKNMRERKKELQQKKPLFALSDKQLKLMRQNIAKLILQAKELKKSRMEVLDKEKSTFKELQKLVNENREHIKRVNIATANKLLEMEMKKESLVGEAISHLGKEVTSLFPEESLLENLTQQMEKKLKETNDKIKDYDKKIADLVKQRQLLLVSEEQAKKEIADLEKKKESLRKSYLKILNGPQPKKKKPVKKKAKK